MPLCKPCWPLTWWLFTFLPHFPLPLKKKIAPECSQNAPFCSYCPHSNRVATFHCPPFGILPLGMLEYSGLSNLQIEAQISCSDSPIFIYLFYWNFFFNLPFNISGCKKAAVCHISAVSVPLQFGFHQILHYLFCSLIFNASHITWICIHATFITYIHVSCMFSRNSNI